ncbi:protein spire [Anopheles ziemanni]|uniref:protein spire n=1 Tax=Anopheles ziemanni TaxID=345580 RepID=UPI0026584BA9|nr:protein spire isoform X1 [Anopheles coustani]XP_058167670.1 protein spire [Anopheles ziemanni]
MASETETPVPTCPPPPETLERGGQCRKVSSKMMPRSGEGDGERVAKIGGGGVRRTEPSAPTVDVSGPAENGGSVGVRGAVVCSGGAGTSVTLEEILKTFNAPISEDQAWALIFQASRMFKARLQESGCRLRDLRLPLHPHQLHVQKDGSCFVTAKTDKELCVPSTQKKILLKLGVVVFKALDFNLSSTEDCHISHELEELIDFMTSEDNDDEGIERDSEEAEEDLATVDGDDCGLRTSLDVVSVSANGCGGERKHLETKELDHVLEYCSARVSPSKSEDHYRAVCRALVTETLELRTFLQRVSQGELRLKVDVETTGKELEKIHFSDWSDDQRIWQALQARFWMQVVDELRRGVRLKKINFSRTPIEYELTPYEILMEDIRSRKYNLRKVMVNGDIPPRVKKDAHAVILEFIRSRPPLRKASERKLAPAPLKRVFCPREQLLDSIRKGRVLKPVHPKLKSRHCESPDDDPCVDAVRDLAYCPPDNNPPVAPTETVAPSPRKPPTPASKSAGPTGLPPINRAPKAAPRTTQPPTPKPRSVLPTTTQLDSVQKSCDDDIDSSSSGAHSLDGVSSTDGEGGSCGGPSFIHQHPTSTSNKTMTLGRPTFSHTGGSSSAPRNTLRLIPVDFSLFNDDDLNDEPVNDGADSSTCSGQQRMQQNGGHRISSGGGGLVVAGVAGGKRSSTDDRTADSTNRLMIVNNENNQNNINTVLRRTKNIITHDEYHRFCDKALETYDLATQCESRRASLRRHTIIGCNQSYKRDPLASHSMPPSRPASRTEQHPPVRSEATPASTTLPAPTTNAPTKEKPSAMVTPHTINGARPAPIGGGSGGGSGGEYGTVGSGSNLSSLDTWTKNSLDEHQWKDTFNLNDRLSLTLEEIVHIRSVMTKAELEGLPVDVHIKEDVEKRKVCFLCLRTRFTLFARGILCKLCQRTVCNKCNTKMRIPTEHFRNVPVVLLSPSLMNSPCTSNTPSPSHHAHGTGSGPTSMVDESFPRSLMERLLRPELDRKTRNTVGSAPSSPKNQRSASSTPGTSLHGTETLSLSLSHHVASANAAKDTVAVANGAVVASSVSAAQRCSLMSRSMEGPNSLPPQSPARPHSNCSTLDRKNRFAKAFTLTTAGGQGGGALDPQKERLTGELMAVCNDCRSLVLEIIRSSRQTRTTARNQVLRHLTLDISPVYK